MIIVRLATYSNHFYMQKKYQMMTENAAKSVFS